MEGKKPIDKKWKQIKEKFSITRFIGSGSCGEVARVKHRETKEVYAVKLVKFDQKNTF
jgi:serine/threonine protein kinase